MQSFLTKIGAGFLIGVALGLFGAVTTPVCSAQASASSDSASADLAGIAHAAIRVADLARSRAFYQKLGFEEAFAMDKDGVPTQSFIKINDRQFLELYPQSKPSDVIGFMHVCFEATEIEQLNRYYRDHGLTPTAVRKAGAGNLLFTMEGPEKQNIEYTQYMPGSRHSNDIGKHLGPNRISQFLFAAGIEMQAPNTARNFYRQELGFSDGIPVERGQIWLLLPSSAHVAQQIKIIRHTPDSTFQMFFFIQDLRHTMALLRSLQIPVERRSLPQFKTLSVKDPDGNQLIFMKYRPPVSMPKQ